VLDSDAEESDDAHVADHHDHYRQQELEPLYLDWTRRDSGK
jgi:hypothetical protein